jgi:hypothetical protein
VVGWPVVAALVGAVGVEVLGVFRQHCGGVVVAEYYVCSGQTAWAYSRTTPESITSSHVELLIDTDNKKGDPSWGITNTRPLQSLPSPRANPTQIARLYVRRRQGLGGILDEYRHEA